MTVITILLVIVALSFTAGVIATRVYAIRWAAKHYRCPPKSEQVRRLHEQIAHLIESGRTRAVLLDRTIKANIANGYHHAKLARRIHRQREEIKKLKLLSTAPTTEGR